MKKTTCLTLAFLSFCLISTAAASVTNRPTVVALSKAAVFAEVGFSQKKKEVHIEPETSNIPPKEEEAVPVLKKTMTTAPSEENELYISNLAEAEYSIGELLSMPDNVQGGSVLILHTHGCESYTPTENNMYKPSSDFRTVDTKFNVVRIGDEIERILTEKGIRVIHDKTLCDYPDYNSSYNNSLSLAKSYVSSNPDIKAVIDVHRDSIEGKNGEQIKTVGGENMSQLMFVIGTDKSGNEHPLWRQNLSFALKLQSRLVKKYPSLMRPINLRTHRFNQQVCPGSIILEVGCDGNTLEEALNSAKIFAEELADYMTK